MSFNSFLYLSSRDLDRTREVNSKIPKSDLNARRRKDPPLLLGVILELRNYQHYSSSTPPFLRHFTVCHFPAHVPRSKNNCRMLAITLDHHHHPHGFLYTVNTFFFTAVFWPWIPISLGHPFYSHLCRWGRKSRCQNWILSSLMWKLTHTQNAF